MVVVVVVVVGVEGENRNKLELVNIYWLFTRLLTALCRLCEGDSSVTVCTPAPRGDQVRRRK